MLEIQEMINFFGIFQILCLALFFLLVVGRTIQIYHSDKIAAVTLTVRSKGIQSFLELSLFFLVNIWIVEVLMYALPLEFRIFPYPLNITLINTLTFKAFGTILIALGFAIFISALVTLGNAWRLGIDEEKPGGLVTKGIYAISRNPIYIFFDLYFLGTFMINGSLIFLVFTVLAAANLHYQILGEEHFLERTYRQIYRDYCTRTARYVSWGSIWNKSRVKSYFMRANQVLNKRLLKNKPIKEL
jgi:protein-S-isoprenylcysteine O-methyltransferase Ste14